MEFLFFVTGVSCFVSSLCFGIFASHVKPKFSLCYFNALVIFKFCSMY